ncbi:MAG: tape measure protein [Planctomycetota bacterium]
MVQEQRREVRLRAVLQDVVSGPAQRIGRALGTLDESIGRTTQRAGQGNGFSALNQGVRTLGDEIKRLDQAVQGSGLEDKVDRIQRSFERLGRNPRGRQATGEVVELQRDLNFLQGTIERTIGTNNDLFVSVARTQRAFTGLRAEVTDQQFRRSPETFARLRRSVEQVAAAAQQIGEGETFQGLLDRIRNLNNVSLDRVQQELREVSQDAREFAESSRVLSEIGSDSAVNDRLATSLTNISDATRQLSNDFQITTSRYSRYRQALLRTLTAQRRMPAAFSASINAIRRFNRALLTVPRRVLRVVRSLLTLRATVVTAIAAAGIFRVVQLADNYQVLGNRLRLVTDGQEELNRALDETFRIAQRTRLPFEVTADLYFRLGRSSRELRADQEALFPIIESVAQAIQLSGVSADSARNALVQFGQGLASSNLGGDELRSVLEQTPRLGRAIAEGLGVGLGELRELGENRQLTTPAIVAAIQSQRETLQAEFETINITVGQAITRLNSSIARSLGLTGQASGVLDVLAQTIINLSDNIDSLTDRLIGEYIPQLRSLFTVISPDFSQRFVQAGVEQLERQGADPRTTDRRRAELENEANNLRRKIINRIGLLLINFDTNEVDSLFELLLVGIASIVENAVRALAIIVTNAAELSGRFILVALLQALRAVPLLGGAIGRPATPTEIEDGRVRQITETRRRRIRVDASGQDVFSGPAIFADPSLRNATSANDPAVRAARARSQEQIVIETLSRDDPTAGSLARAQIALSNRAPRALAENLEAILGDGGFIANVTEDLRTNGASVRDVLLDVAKDADEAIGDTFDENVPSLLDEIAERVSGAAESAVNRVSDTVNRNISPIANRANSFIERTVAGLVRQGASDGRNVDRFRFAAREARTQSDETGASRLDLLADQAEERAGFSFEGEPLQQVQAINRFLELLRVQRQELAAFDAEQVAREQTEFFEQYVGDLEFAAREAESRNQEQAAELLELQARQERELREARDQSPSQLDRLRFVQGRERDLLRVRQAETRAAEELSRVLDTLADKDADRLRQIEEGTLSVSEAARQAQIAGESASEAIAAIRQELLDLRAELDNNPGAQRSIDGTLRNLNRRSAGALQGRDTRRGVQLDNASDVFTLDNISLSLETQIGQLANYQTLLNNLGGVAIGAFQQVGTAIANAALGFESFGDAIRNVGATIISSIGQILVQFAALRTASLALNFVGGFTGSATGSTFLSTVDFSSVAAAEGGLIDGPSGRDVIPARLTREEFVQPAESTRFYGAGFMEALRRRLVPREITDRFSAPAVLAATGQVVRGMFNTGGSVTGSRGTSGGGSGVVPALIVDGPQAERLAGLLAPFMVDALEARGFTLNRT